MQTWLRNAFVFSLFLFLFEIIVVGGNPLYLIVFAIVVGFLLSFLTDFISKKINKHK